MREEDGGSESTAHFAIDVASLDESVLKSFHQGAEVIQPYPSLLQLGKDFKLLFFDIEKLLYWNL